MSQRSQSGAILAIVFDFAAACLLLAAAAVHRLLPLLRLLF
jgi:hypothetical protein